MVDPPEHQRPAQDDLAKELAVVVHVGADPSHKLVDKLDQLRALSLLDIVRSKAVSEKPQDLALAIVKVLESAVDKLNGQDSRAAEILLGLDPGTHGQNVTRRRAEANARLFGDKTKSPSAFLKHQSRLLLEVAEKIYVEETDHRTRQPPVRLEILRSEALSDEPQDLVLSDAGSEELAVVAVDRPPPSVAPTSGSILGGVGRPRRRPKRGWVLVIGAAVAISAVVGLVLNARSREPRPPASTVLLTETFKGPNRGWTDDDFFHYENGSYRGVLPAGPPGGRTSRAPVLAAQLPPDLRVSVVGTKTSSGRGGSFGVFCRDTGGLRYGARIDPQAQNYTIYKVEVAGQPETTLVPETFSGRIDPKGPNTVALDCTGDAAGQKPVALALIVKGQRVGGYVDPTGYPAGQAGVEVASDAAGIEVRFAKLVLSSA